jgi:hypothetical protein
LIGRWPAFDALFIAIKAVLVCIYICAYANEGLQVDDHGLSCKEMKGACKAAAVFQKITTAHLWALVEVNGVLVGIYVYCVCVWWRL